MSHVQNRRLENIKDTACQHLKSVSAAGCTAGRTTHAQRCNATTEWHKKKTRCHANHIVVLSSGVETTHPKTPRLGNRLLATRKIIGEHKNKSMQPNFQRVRLCLLGTKPENVQCEPLTRISRPHVVASVRLAMILPRRMESGESCHCVPIRTQAQPRTTCNNELTSDVAVIKT